MTRSIATLFAVAAVISALAILPSRAAGEGTDRENDAEGHSFRFDGESFARAWRHETDHDFRAEFLREGDTLTGWHRMITYFRFDTVDRIPPVLEQYMVNAGPLLARQPQVLENHDTEYDRDMAVMVLLRAPDGSHYEFVINRFVAEAGHPVRSVIFSVRIHVPDEGEPDFEAVVAQRHDWLEGLGKLSIEHLAELAMAEEDADEDETGRKR